MMPFALIAGDLLSNLAIGAIVGALCSVAVGPAWPMFPAMLAGMFGGMLLAFIWSPLVSIWLGAHEAMIPAMLTGMSVGMVVPMRAAMNPTTVAEGALLGAAIGLGSLLFSYLLNAFLRGEQRVEASE